MIYLSGCQLARPSSVRRSMEFGVWIWIWIWIWSLTWRCSLSGGVLLIKSMSIGRSCTQTPAGPPLVQPKQSKLPNVSDQNHSNFCLAESERAATNCAQQLARVTAKLACMLMKQQSRLTCLISIAKAHYPAADLGRGLCRPNCFIVVLKPTRPTFLLLLLLLRRSDCPLAALLTGAAHPSAATRQGRRQKTTTTTAPSRGCSRHHLRQARGHRTKQVHGRPK